MKNGMGSHQNHKMLKDEWLTPPFIMEKLGVFDLDPCAPVDRPWDTAKQHYTVHDNGLVQPWQGRVWCNPPYGKQAETWLARLADHGNGIALIFARTETKMFFSQVWDRADSLLFIEGRLYFHHVCGRKASANAGAPSVLIAYGSDNSRLLEDCGISGKFIDLRPGSCYK